MDIAAEQASVKEIICSEKESKFKKKLREQKKFKCFLSFCWDTGIVTKLGKSKKNILKKS